MSKGKKKTGAKKPAAKATKKTTGAKSKALKITANATDVVSEPLDLMSQISKANGLKPPSPVLSSGDVAKRVSKFKAGSKNASEQQEAIVEVLAGLDQDAIATKKIVKDFAKKVGVGVADVRSSIKIVAQKRSLDNALSLLQLSSSDEDSAPPAVRSSDNDAPEFRRSRSSNAVLAGDPVNAMSALNELGYKFRENLFSLNVHIKAPVIAPDERVIGDSDLARVTYAISDRFHFTPTNDALEKAVKELAARNAWHPVRDYLEAVNWDGIKRVDTWLSVYLGASEGDLHAEFGKRWLIAAVARIYEPGAKFDQCPVLEGVQGSGKSTALRILATRSDWFTDGVPLDADGKVTIEQTSGKWFVELAELAGMRAADVDKAKTFLSRDVDHGRKPYARISEDIPRQFTCAGTTNNKKYLKDPTGNRRYWPILTGTIDEKALRRDVDQLWAEVVTMYRAGEGWALPPTYYAAAAQVQEGRQIANEYLERLEDKLGSIGEPGAKISAAAVYLLCGLGEAVKSYVQSDVTAAMEKLGWHKRKVRIGGETVNGFRYGPDTDDRRGPQAGDKSPEYRAQLNDDKRTYSVTGIEAPVAGGLRALVGG